MPNRLKHKLSRMIPSFQLCRSKDPSSSAKAPTPAIYKLSPFNPKALDINYPILPAPPPSTPYYKCQVSRKIISVGCKCQSRSCPRCSISSDWSIESPDLGQKKEFKWQAKPHLSMPFSFSDESGDMSPFMVTGKNKNRGINIKKSKDKTSVLSVDTTGCLSSTDVADEETENLLFSSRSFSYDSSCEFSHSLDRVTKKSYYETFNKSIGNKKVSNIKKIKKLGRHVSLSKWKRSKTVLSPEIPSPVRSSVLKRMISCKVDGKVKESVAVVKKSHDPYRDFKRSMLEMILERQIFEAEDLEELLQCFLSLNSRKYHGVIVQAFSEVWEIVFCDSPVKKTASIRH
ncbi:unnamed protein product [Dovyalis caffra]|uniref:Transcription repressor n=1 Tax=Dovyalis caffra TaxID=77055 RepID=A0AAV1SD47_9ROSI|nr:unnamed protein product [Dovyalis caffra]